ncbi:unnamed protein product [Lymnaea stagnalis]|uniref:Elongation of very long chain fatty acids protein n=1 Tax=Lymnaea stagnalis TaxID=6523 RepID=A0AAV2I8G0_LYMST
MDFLVKNYYSISIMMPKADNRVSDWFLMSSPLPTLALVTLYLAIIIHGQSFMKNINPFDLKGVMVVYNCGLVILSAYMLHEFVMSSWTVNGFNLLCQPMDYSDDVNSVRLAGACWWFFISKLIELLDTVFFVLRKKNNQISFLHVYHHTTMPILWWVGVKFVAGGEAYFSTTFNSGVHVLMYLYYMLSAVGPALQPYLWWKKYLTTLQLVQFWVVLVKTVVAIVVDCGYPVGYEYFLVFYMVSHIILFTHFYKSTYHKPRNNPKYHENNNIPEPKQPLKGNIKGELRERK